MINVLPIRGGSCQLFLRQGPLAGVVAVLGLLMCLKRQEVGVMLGGCKKELRGRKGQDHCSQSMQILL
jgi:hypothetical protein